MSTHGLHARAFFDLQIEFARAVSALGHLALADAVLNYTNFYIRFGFGRAFDPTHPGWQSYLAGLRDADDPREWTYRFYVTRPHPPPGPSVEATFGCFSYARSGTDRLRLHFLNAEPDGRSPLGRDRRDERLADLAALFAHVRRTVSSPVSVAGASWLYNLPAYRRLFPESYVATARVLPDRFRHLPLWGQFLDRHGELRADLARQFRERLARQTSLEGLDGCFPYQVLAVEAPVAAFYEFYGV